MRCTPTSVVKTPKYEIVNFLGNLYINQTINDCSYIDFGRGRFYPLKAFVGTSGHVYIASNTLHLECMTINFKDIQCLLQLIGTTDAKIEVESGFDPEYDSCSSLINVSVTLQ